MIPGDAFLVWIVPARAFLRWPHHNFVSFDPQPIFTPEARGFWEGYFELWANQEPMRIDVTQLELVAMPTCGCCGTTRVDTTCPVWRCTKHIGRLPCLIEGCGKTFAMKGDDTYGNIVICGAHWRQAPKYMRDAVARVRRLAKRRGWTDALLTRHHRLWERCHRAIRDGRRIDETEINKLMGWETT